MTGDAQAVASAPAACSRSAVRLGVVPRAGRRRRRTAARSGRCRTAGSSPGPAAARRPRRRPARQQVMRSRWRKARAITRRQAARWKKVPSGWARRSRPSRRAAVAGAAMSPGSAARRAASAANTLVHAVPAEVAQQAVEPRRHGAEVDAVAEALARPACGDARLAGVDLPGVEVEHPRPPCCRVSRRRRRGTARRASGGSSRRRRREGCGRRGAGWSSGSPRLPPAGLVRRSAARAGRRTGRAGSGTRWSCSVAGSCSSTSQAQGVRGPIEKVGAR